MQLASLLSCASLALLACGKAPPPAGPELGSPVDTGRVSAPAEQRAVPAADCAAMDLDDSWTRALLERALGESPILSDPAAHRLQVLVGEIDATAAQPCITWHPYRVGAEYIYPASAIKPIAAVAALSAFRRRKAEDPALGEVGLHTLLRVVGQAPEKQAEGEPPPPPLTVAGQIGAALSVSSNPAYNFTVDLAGYNDLHQLMWSRGLKSVRLRHRLSLFGLTEKDQRTTSRIMAVLPDAEVELVARRESKMRVPLHGQPRAGVGQRHRQRGSRQPLEGPKDFSEKNAVALTDLARLTAWIADPALVPELSFPLLQPEDRELIKASMAHLPEDWPLWMPLRTGLTEVLPAEDLVYVHKSGMAYGFYLDIGHVQQRSTGRAFVLAVASHLNPNGVVNDGVYGYEQLGHPMMQALGRQLGRELLLGERP